MSLPQIWEKCCKGWFKCHCPDGCECGCVKCKCEGEPPPPVRVRPATIVVGSARTRRRKDLKEQARLRRMEDDE